MSSHKKCRKIPSLEMLDKLFVYNREAGTLKRKITRGSHKAGCIAGSISKRGYRVILIGSVGYGAHRIIWKMHYGKDPIRHIDHINGDKLDNRIGNLRDVSQSENNRNSKRYINNKSGVSGVCWDKSQNRWQVRVRIDGKPTHLGVFKEFSEAVAVRKKAERDNGYHPNHGRYTE